MVHKEELHKHNVEAEQDFSQSSYCISLLTEALMNLLSDTKDTSKALTHHS